MFEYSEEIKKMNLWEKIANISNEIDYLQKDDTVGFGNNSYKAISSEKVIGVCSEKMTKYGVIIYPSKQTYKRTDEAVTDKQGNAKYNRISDVDVEYMVVNIHSPSENIITVASGTGVDTQDKGVGKAQTYAYKNMLVKLFAIPTGDDTDKVHSDDYTKKLYGEDKPKEDEAVTKDDLDKLYKLAYAKGYLRDEVNSAVKTKFKKDIKEVNRTEYDQMYQGYKNAKKKGEK